MTTIARISRDNAKYRPASHYEHPSELVAEPMMTRGEKIATLNRWRQQITDELAAADDGMPTRRTSGQHHRLLEEITDALRDLG